jgi:hypothetical protein
MSTIQISLPSTELLGDAKIGINVKNNFSSLAMRVAVQGCCHGELDKIYASIQLIHEKYSKIDLLIICGDFQSIRNNADLQSMGNQ